MNLKELRQLIEESRVKMELPSTKGVIDVSNDIIRDELNVKLTAITGPDFLTPYSALEAVRKVLAGYHISIPQYTFMEGHCGTAIFDVDQFGFKAGMTVDGKYEPGEDVEKDLTHGEHIPGESFTTVLDGTPEGSDLDPRLYVYFEYQLNDDGRFDVFCEVVDDDELAEIEEDHDMEDDDDEDPLYEEKGSMHSGEKTISVAPGIFLEPTKKYDIRKSPNAHDPNFTHIVKVDGKEYPLHKYHVGKLNIL